MEDTTPVSGLTWADTRRYLLDLEALLAANIDNDALTAFRSAKSEIFSIFNNAHYNAKKIISDLQSELAHAASASAQALLPIEELRAQIELLEQKKNEILAQVSRMQAMRDASIASINQLTQSTKTYREMLDSLAANQTSQVPKVRHSLTLYANICSIRWNYDAVHTAEGYVAPPSGSPRPFRFDTTVLSQTQLADALWEVVREAHGYNL